MFKIFFFFFISKFCDFSIIVISILFCTTAVLGEQDTTISTNSNTQPWDRDGKVTRLHQISPERRNEEDITKEEGGFYA